MIEGEGDNAFLMGVLSGLTPQFSNRMCTIIPTFTLPRSWYAGPDCQREA